MDKQANNVMYLSGEIVSEPKLSYTGHDDCFYDFELSIKRLSGKTDTVPITCPGKLMASGTIQKGVRIRVAGEFRSYNKLEGGRSRLILQGFVRRLAMEESADDMNNVALNGYICKPPAYRTTPLDREITDVLIAVHRPNGKSDYIPCVVWGRNARFVRDLCVGDSVALVGRIQSREYEKKTSNGSPTTRTAYEVSVSKIVAHGAEEAIDVERIFTRGDE